MGRQPSVRRAYLYTRTDYSRPRPIVTFAERDWRGQFRRDFARLLHSPAFRRLQGKTQLFSGMESDFFRNRLTHSLEVAQIAKSIALKINREHLANLNLVIDTDLVEFAGLAHDLGHPPFGHTGERVLNELMQNHGGFEGNAQTLRILARLEKKLDDPDTQLNEQAEPIWYDRGRDQSIGLNLCSRTLASILKYDHKIPDRVTPTRITKGYYGSEVPVVRKLKSDVAPGVKVLKTIECQIMDVADDIAYSTYDIEDALKAGLTNPVQLMYPGRPLIEAVTTRCRRGLGDPTFTAVQARSAAARCLGDFVPPDLSGPDAVATAKYISESGYFRNALTSSLVRRFVDGVVFKLDSTTPSVSEAYLERSVHEEVEVLKHFTYELMIESNRLKIVAKRADFILRTIMEALTVKDGHELLPNDFRRKYIQAAGGRIMRNHRASDTLPCMRVMCDFVAGMTDKYAVEFFSRLRSETYQTIFRDY